MLTIMARMRRRHNVFFKMKLIKYYLSFYHKREYHRLIEVEIIKVKLMDKIFIFIYCVGKQFNICNQP